MKSLRWILPLAALTLLCGNSQAGIVFNQGFETDTAGWIDSSGGWVGNVTRVASGAGGITSASGSHHAVVVGPTNGPFTRFDGYRSAFPGQYTASLDVYLDTSWSAGEGFDYSVASNGSDGLHQRDFIFHATNDTSTGSLLVGASNNTDFAPREDLESINHVEIGQSGWYTLQHVFRDIGGVLSVDMNLVDSGGSVVFTETRTNIADTIPGAVGGNRYGWLTTVKVDTGIAIDNTQLSLDAVPEPSTWIAFAGVAVAGVGFRRVKRKR